MLRRYKLLAAVTLGLSFAIFLCTLALRPAIPALTYSVYTPYNLEAGVGVVIIAPYGDHQWEKNVLSVVNDLGSRFPTEVAFGEANAAAIQIAAEKLTARNVDRIIIVPLLTSSHSQSTHKMRYILGLESSPGMLEDTLHPVSLDVPFVVGQPMDSNPLLASIISDRAKDLSHKSSEESLVVVVDAPRDERENRLWKMDAGKLSSAIRAESGFRKVIFTLAYEQSYRLRHIVKTESQYGKVIVVPLFWGDNGLRKRVLHDLKGLDYSMSTKPLLPHPKVVEWLRESIDHQLIIINWKQIAGNDMVMET